jgi:nicotinamide-nucleotide amidase
VKGKVRVPRAYLVCVGSELLAGQVNTHQAWLSVRLRRAGFDVVGESSLPDSIPEIAAAMRRALDSADAVIVSGGLGPTFDDLTREAAAAALGRRIRFDPKLWRVILARFARYHASVPEQNKRQAEVIDGAEVLANGAGSAPGQKLEFRGKDGRPGPSRRCLRSSPASCPASPPATRAAWGAPPSRCGSSA